MTDTSSVSSITPIGKPGRHHWADPVRFPYKTERSCTICGLVKVTRHEPSQYPWLEFWRDGVRVQCDRTPECVAT